MRDVLARHGTLLLHGPAHHPGYYGQLERQNREHRAWLAGTGADPVAAADTMPHALNGLWRRRKLNWCTSAEAWSARPVLDIDRAAFGQDVQDRAARLTDHLGVAAPNGLANRLAIEQVLTARGYLRIETGGR